jgi:putative selenate reductase
MPDDPMYLSGPPLHVLATTLLDELLSAMPNVFKVAGHNGDVQVTFSAGVTKENLSTTVGMGVAPATLSSDLLKPGGYGRLEPMLRKLTGDMRAADVRNLADWHNYNWLEARTAGYRGPVEAHVRAILDGPELDRYSYSGNQKTRRRVAHELQMWGCVACNFCVTVCPNDAFFSISTPEGSGLVGRQQYMVLAELCNDCGNCMTFCPEDGDPAQVKPKLFLTKERFDMAEGQGFLLRAENGRLDVTSKPESESETERLVSVINNEEGIPVGVNLH